MSRERGGRSLTTVPPIAISPPVISSRPAIIRSSVDLPQPEGPTKTTNSPERIARSMPWITWLSPYALTTLVSVTSDMISARACVRWNAASVIPRHFAGRLRPRSRDHRRLREPGIDDDALPGDRSGCARRKEQHRTSNIVFGDAKLQALLLEQDLLPRGVDPERTLPRGVDGAGHDRVDTDAVAAELARERSRQPEDRRLRADVRRESRASAHPRNRAEVDDRAAARRRHRRRDR